MEIDKKKAIIIAIIIVAGTAFAVSAPNGLVTYIENFTGLEESDRKIMESIDLGDLPDYFEASIIVEGSKYTGQLHTVDLNISHTRTGSSVWLADGEYSLYLEDVNEALIGFPIMFGSFANLTDTEPFSNSNPSWRPTCPSGTYFIALNLTDLQWIHGYIIDASVTGLGGQIDPIGSVTVREGAIQSFTITADSGYEIDDVLVNGSSVGAVDAYSFINVQADGQTIEAVFALEKTTFSSDEVSMEDISLPITGFNISIPETRFNGSLTYDYDPSDTIEFNMTLKQEGTKTTGYLYYNIYYEFLDTSGRTLVINATTTNDRFTYDLNGGFCNLTGDFTAPSFGEYRLIFEIVEVQ